jgi:hypothetical protein
MYNRNPSLTKNENEESFQSNFLISSSTEQSASNGSFATESEFPSKEGFIYLLISENNPEFGQKIWQQLFWVRSNKYKIVYSLSEQVRTINPLLAH